MRKNNILKVSVIVMLMTALVSMSSLFVVAGNYKDTPWTFEIGPHGKIGYITQYGREKQDDTGVYIKCDGYTASYGSMGTSFQATAYGSNNPNNGFFNCTYNGNSSRTYNVQKGSVYKMVNYINEAKYKYANIWCYAAYNANVTFSGVWSPDSI